MKGVITIVKNISHNMQSPHNRPVIIMVCAFVMAGLPAGAVSGPWRDETPQTRLVFIARHGTVNFAAVEKALNGCKARSHRGADSLEAKGTTGAGPRQAQSGRSIRTTS